VQRAFAGGTVAEQDRALDGLRRAGSLAAITATQVVVLPQAGLAGAGRVVALLTSDPQNGEAVRAAGHVLQGHIELGCGRLAAAERELEAARALGCMEAREFRALFMLAPFVDLPAGRLESLRGEMLGWDVAEPADAPPPIPHFAPHRGVHAQLQLFLLGLANARLDAGDSALRQAADLDSAASGSDDIVLRSFAVTIRAEVAHVRHGAGAALEVWDTHELGTSVERALSSSFYSLGHARFARAEMLRLAGRHNEARAWYATFGDLAIQDAIYLGPAYLRLAELLRDSGESAGAVRHYRQFIDLWKDCDAALQPLTAAARQELAHLTSPDPTGSG
jgi:tetratricopeptide (TPR) repeat protein